MYRIEAYNNFLDIKPVVTKVCDNEQEAEAAIRSLRELADKINEAKEGEDKNKWVECFKCNGRKD